MQNTFTLFVASCFYQIMVFISNLFIFINIYMAKTNDSLFPQLSVYYAWTSLAGPGPAMPAAKANAPKATITYFL